MKEKFRPIKEKILAYCLSKGENLSGHNEIKCAFFLTILSAIDTDMLTNNLILNELSVLTPIGTNQLFYKANSWGPTKECQAAKLIVELFQILDFPLTDEQLNNIVNGKISGIENHNSYNPFAEENYVELQPHADVSTNPFNNMVINPNPSNNPFVNMISHPRPSTNPFDNMATNPNMLFISPTNRVRNMQIMEEDASVKHTAHKEPALPPRKR